MSPASHPGTCRTPTDRNRKPAVRAASCAHMPPLLHLAEPIKRQRPVGPVLNPECQLQGARQAPQTLCAVSTWTASGLAVAQSRSDVTI